MKFLVEYSVKDRGTHGAYKDIRRNWEKQDVIAVIYQPGTFTYKFVLLSGLSALNF